MESVMKVGLLVFLLAAAMQDMQTKKISVRLLLVGTVLLTVGYIIVKPVSILSAIFGIVEGSIVLGVSILTKGKIGRADGLVLMLCGMILGGYLNMLIMFVSFLSAGLAGGLLELTGKIPKRSKLPYLPFLLFSAAGGCLV